MTIPTSTIAPEAAPEAAGMPAPDFDAAYQRVREEFSHVAASGQFACIESAMLNVDALLAADRAAQGRAQVGSILTGELLRRLFNELDHTDECVTAEEVSSWWKHYAAKVRLALGAPQAAPTPQPLGEAPAGQQRKLQFPSPAVLSAMFRSGTKFRLHYHGKTFDVERMKYMGGFVLVQPPAMPVSIYADGSSKDGPAIWLEELATPAPQPQPAPRKGLSELTFAEFRAANVARCIKWHPAGIDSWSTSDWMVAIMGELGEAASLIKMRNRERDGLPGNKFSPTQKQIADEIADVLTYLDLFAEVNGVDLGAAAAEKSNEVSERVGFPDRILLRTLGTPAPGGEDKP